MTFDEFDQSENGWRAQAKSGDCAGAAQAIEAYLEAHSDQEDWQLRTLHFHALQMHAFAGDNEQALRHMPFSLIPNEDPESKWHWNDYVAATEAFLRDDLVAFQAARKRMMTGPSGEEHTDPNLHVVDRLLAGFGKPYSQVY